MIRGKRSVDERADGSRRDQRRRDKRGVKKRKMYQYRREGGRIGRGKFVERRL